MGSCTASRVVEESRVRKVVFTRSMLEMNHEYLNPEIRHEIFRAKDQRATTLFLERNEFYLKKKAQNARSNPSLC